jgi:hypothetical protein
MQFEELKRIWDSQDATAATIDVAALEERVRNRARAAECGASVPEIVLMAIMGLTGSVLAIAAFRAQHPPSSYVSATFGFGIAAYVYLVRRRRLNQKQGFDDSLLGRVEQGIADVDAQIALARSFFWWCILPMAAGTLASMYGTFHDRQTWVWLTQALAWVLAFAVVQRGLHRHQVPRREELARMRRELLSHETTPPGE